MEITTLSEELVFAVVRGQLPLSALGEAGVHFEIDGMEPGEERRIKLNVKVPFIVAPKPIDIAQGLLAYRQRPDQLRDWAGFVLGASELIDLEPLDEWPKGDQLLNGLWDASFEGEVKPETMQVAEALAES